MTVAFDDSRSDVADASGRKVFIMTISSPGSRVENRSAVVRSENTSANSMMDFRLRFANRVVEESWRERKAIWTREDIGILLLDVLEEELSFDWSRPDAIDQLKEFLAVAYIVVGDVLPATQRAF